MEELTKARSKQNQNRYFHHLRAFLQVEYCILIWSALSTPGNRKGMPESLKNAKLKNRELITMQKGNLCAWVWKDKKNVFYLSTNCDPTAKGTAVCL
jgi:hypothetical protein